MQNAGFLITRLILCDLSISHFGKDDRIVSDFTSFHYANTPMLFTAIFHSCKNDNFQMKNCDIFLIFAQNIDRGYTLEPRRF